MPNMRAALVSTAVVAGGLALAGAARAGGCTTGCTPAPPTCCNIPSTHTVSVPGVTVTPPTIVIAPQRIQGGVEFGGSVGVDVSVSTSASASASSNALNTSSALATANSQAANLLAASGGGAFFSEGGSNGTIPLVVSAPTTQTRQVCVRRAAAFKAVAIQAVCLDDKLVPHPASQTAPGRDVAEGYAGELFRCIAGAHMQYVLADWAGEAKFDHGQTVVCQKGDALWREGSGRLVCKPQTPARDCNERSLLRRYGAGIKVLKASVAEQCVEWRSETVQAEATSTGTLELGGGVG